MRDLDNIHPIVQKKRIEGRPRGTDWRENRTIAFLRCLLKIFKSFYIFKVRNYCANHVNQYGGQFDSASSAMSRLLVKVLLKSG